MNKEAFKILVDHEFTSSHYVRLYAFLKKLGIKNYQKYSLNDEISKANWLSLLVNFIWFILNFVYLSFLYIFVDKSIFFTFKLKNVQCGKYISTRTLRDPKNNLSTIRFLFYYCLNYFKLSRYFSLCTLYRDKYDAIFLNDSFYFNGFLIDYFIRYSRSIAFLNINPNPFIIYDGNEMCIDDFLNPRFYETYSFMRPKKSIDTIMTNRLKNPNQFIYYYDPEDNNTHFVSSNSSKVKIIVYAHSFTDVQMKYGYDGFKSTYDWLVYTLDNISHQYDLYIKCHPNFYRKKTKSNIERFDKSIWQEIIKKYVNHHNFTVIDYSIDNFRFLKNFLPENTLLIQHHGNSLIEGAYLGFRSISSSKSPWGRYLSFSHVWNNKSQYLELLKNIPNLINDDIDNQNLYKLISYLYLSDDNIYGKNHLNFLIPKILGISIKELIRNPNLIDKSKLESITEELYKSIHLID